MVQKTPSKPLLIGLSKFINFLQRRNIVKTFISLANVHILGCFLEGKLTKEQIIYLKEKQELFISFGGVITKIPFL